MELTNNKGEVTVLADNLTLKEIAEMGFSIDLCDSAYDENEHWVAKSVVVKTISCPNKTITCPFKTYKVSYAYFSCFFTTKGTHMYIRSLRKPSPNKNIYKFSSLKNRDAVMCEGSLERDCCYHFEYDPDVVHYESQPEGFYYDFHGEKRPLHS
ncbi:hypothetical protein [Photobacterium leiognathi]|uniref:hypothetical protein n=1 Tax=Photobacterium leiognathi TaxID=553611 RepID=UPI00273817C2|nr:hypothetical protein [Photobacterium leiognathi]